MNIFGRSPMHRGLSQEEILKIGLVCEDATMYTFRNGQLSISTGSVYSGSIKSKQPGRFCNNCGMTMSGGLVCSDKPGIVYNVYMWLPIRDDEWAKRIWIDHKEKAMLRAEKEMLMYLSHMSIISELSTPIIEE